MESPGFVALYESRLWRRGWLLGLLLRIPFEAELERVSAALNVVDDDLVLDLGCGTGIHSRPLARQAARGSVVGVDLSVAMVRRAVQLAARESLPNTLFVRGDAQSIPLPSDRVNAVCCCGALHLFPDASLALREMYRVLRPGGRIAIATFRRRGGTLSEAVTRIRRTLTGMDAYLPEDLEERLRQTGFTRVSRYHAGGVWLIVGASKEAA